MPKMIVFIRCDLLLLRRNVIFCLIFIFIMPPTTAYYIDYNITSFKPVSCQAANFENGTKYVIHVTNITGGGSSFLPDGPSYCVFAAYSSLFPQFWVNFPVTQEALSIGQVDLYWIGWLPSVAGHHTVSCVDGTGASLPDFNNDFIINA